MDYMTFIFYLFALFSVQDVVLELCPPNVETIICQFSTCTLRCEPPKLISIKYADYGRTIKNKCRQYRYNNLKCSTPNAKQKISEECENKTTCDVKAINDVFGNPCIWTYKYVNLSYTCSDTHRMTLTTPEITAFIEIPETATLDPALTTETSHIAPPTLQTVGIIVDVVDVLVILLICLFLLLYRRLKLKRKDPRIDANASGHVNSPVRLDILTQTNEYQQCRYNSVYHQYSELSPPTPTVGTFGEYITGILDINCNSSRMSNNSVYQTIDGADDFTSNKSDLKRANNENDDAYFILDPNETGICRLKESPLLEPTKPSSNEYEFTQPTHQKDIRGNVTDGNTEHHNDIRGNLTDSDTKHYNDILGNVTDGDTEQNTDICGNLTDGDTEHYNDINEYDHVQNIYQVKDSSEDLYDRVADQVYDVSFHERTLSIDENYDHFKRVK